MKVRALALAAVSFAACGESGREATPTASAGPVPIVQIIADAQYYPGCANQPVTIGGAVWYPLAEFEFGDELADILATPREAPSAGIRGIALRVAPPGPGDDTGTLVVYADGFARYETDNGLVIWLTQVEHTYNWVC